MQINNNNNVNFTAKLNLSGIKSNKNLWNSVAEKFEEKTTKTPYDFKLSLSDGELDIYATTTTKRSEPEHSCTLSKESTKKLMAMTPEKITQKLVKLLNSFKRHDKTVDTGLGCLEKLGKNDKFGTLTDTFDSGVSAYDKVLWAVVDKANMDKNIIMSKDPIFKNAKFID